MIHWWVYAAKNQLPDWHLIVDICHNHTTGGGVLFSSWCTFQQREREIFTYFGPFWPILAILSRTYVRAFGVLFTGLNNNGAVYQNWQISGTRYAPSHLHLNLWAFRTKSFRHIWAVRTFSLRGLVEHLNRNLANTSSIADHANIAHLDVKLSPYLWDKHAMKKHSLFNSRMFGLILL